MFNYIKIKIHEKILIYLILSVFYLIFPKRYKTLFFKHFHRNWKKLSKLIWLLLLLMIIYIHAHRWLRTNSIFRRSWRWFLRSNSLFNKLVLSKIIQILYWISDINVLHSSVIRRSTLQNFIRHSLCAWTCRSLLSCPGAKRSRSRLACPQAPRTTLVLFILRCQLSCW